MNEIILKKAKKIKLIALDIDGVLTEGKLIILNSGEEIKIWNVKDRFAHTLLNKSGLNIKLAWITARQSDQVAIRASELKIDYVYQKYIDKLKAINDIISKEQFKYENIAYIGDDWLDIPALCNCGLSVCPKDAHEEVKKIVDYISKFNGGKGVFREVVEIILKSHNLYDKILKTYKE